MILILNYGIGNVLSIMNMFRKIGVESCLSSSGAEFENDCKLVLPGVGHFDYGMRLLRKAPFYELMLEKVINQKVPILGICLGAQMLMDFSEEGNEKGLGLIKGCCKRFDKAALPVDFTVPNMGWLDVDYVRNSKINSPVSPNPRYYFVHSYHICCNDSNDILATAEYGYSFTAAISRENIFGVQFHPEKSHKFGLEVLRNFAGL